MPSAFSDLTKNAQWYLAQVDPAKPAEAFTWQVMAARSYLALGQAKPAAALFQQLQKQGQSTEQKAQLQLLQAHLLLAQGNANQALILLEGKPEVALDADTQKDWYRQRVVLQLDINNKFGAAKSLILLEPYLAQNELATNHQQIWSLLKSMTLHPAGSGRGAGSRRDYRLAATGGAGERVRRPAQSAGTPARWLEAGLPEPPGPERHAGGSG